MTDKHGRDNSSRVLALFEDGRRFAEDLLKENERLRALNAQLKLEKRELEKKTADLEHLATLEEQVRSLEVENQELRAQFTSIEDENREFADRYMRVERQNSNLLSLYVATHQLHSTLEHREVVGVIKEIIINMVGSEHFGVYVLDAAGGRLLLIGEEGLGADAPREMPLGDGILKRAVESGEPLMAAEGTPLHRRQAEPIACIPLKVGSQVLGVVGIYQLLDQKRSFEEVDQDLFALLGGNAAKALYVSKLHSTLPEPQRSAEGIAELLLRGV